MPEISVIVPVYNVEAYLDRCVRSILGQSFQNFELILVDDGSPDNCGALCDGYACEDDRIHVIHQENGGLSAARNAGIDWVQENSTSQWIAFVDSDDWVHHEFLRALYEAAVENNCLVSACGSQITAGEPLEEKQDLSVQVLSADDYYCGSFHESVTPASCCKLYHISLFKTLRFPLGKLHEDEFTTYLALYTAGKVAATQAKLDAYFQNPDSITLSKWNPRRLDALEGMEGQIAFAQHSGNARLLKNKVETYIYSAYEHLGQADAGYRSMIRQKLRWGLKLGRECGCFPKMKRILWAYEAAYPCKPFWWFLSKIQK